MQQTIKIILVSLFIFSISSCQKSDVNDLQQAQLCLNTATAAEASNCVTAIASNTTENAYKLRCAAVFISKGFGAPTSFISALDQIKNGGNDAGCTGGTCSGSLAAMGSLNFGTDAAASNLALSECTSSGVGIYAQISSIFKMGTMLTVLTGGTTTTAALEAQVANLPAEDIGNIVLTTHSTSCQNLTGASESTVKYCAELSAAIAAGTTPAAIGQYFKDKLDTPVP